MSTYVPSSDVLASYAEACLACSRLYSWLLLAGLASVAIGQNLNAAYIPPSRCLPASDRLIEVTNTITRTVATTVVRPTTVIQYRTVTIPEYRPSISYRTVTRTEYRPVTSVRQETVTVPQIQEVTQTQVLPASTVTSVVTVTTPKVVYSTVLSTHYVTQRIVTTRTERVTSVRTETLTYPLPVPVYKTRFETIRTTDTRRIVKTEYNTITSTVLLPATTNTAFTVTTRVSAQRGMDLTGQADKLPKSVLSLHFNRANASNASTACLRKLCARTLHDFVLTEADKVRLM